MSTYHLLLRSIGLDQEQWIEVTEFESSETVYDFLLQRDMEVVAEIEGWVESIWRDGYDHNVDGEYALLPKGLKPEDYYPMPWRVTVMVEPTFHGDIDV